MSITKSSINFKSPKLDDDGALDRCAPAHRVHRQPPAPPRHERVKLADLRDGGAQEDAA